MNIIKPEEIGESIRSTVKKAAKLAVYDEIMINVKNHHNPATIRVDVALSIYIKLNFFSFYHFILRPT